ncbi:hypothetical protein BT69DRAFT_1282146 [Atractiella rhizophila]|nr:hypothetical protein BT69DRAFT_1282146 [Atractiella rhizophila]
MADEGSADGDEGDHKKKRNRLLTVVLAFRRKIKCDRKIPCVACIKRGDNDKCRWEEVAPQPVIHILQSRVARLESLLQAQSHHNQTHNHQRSPPALTPTTTNSHASPAQAASLKPSELDSLLRTVAITNRAEKAEKRSEDAAQALEDIAMSLHAEAPSRVRPPSRKGTSVLLRDPPAWEREGSRGRVLSLLDKMDADKEKRYRTLIWGILPNNKVMMDRIVGWYFDRLSWCFHLIHKPSWEKWYQEYWRLVDGGWRDDVDPGFLAILSAVLSLGSICYIPNKDEQLPELLDEEDYAYLPDLYNRASMMSLEIAKWTENPTYFVALSLSLFIPFMCMRGSGPKFRIWAAAGTRVCYQLGYHRLAQDVNKMPQDSKGLPPGNNTLKREMCLWVFQNFMWVRWVESIFPNTTGGPWCDIATKDVILPLNCNDNELSSTSTYRPEYDDSVYTDLSFDRTRLRIGLVSAKIFKAIASGSMSYEQVVEIDQEYQMVLRGRPKQLQPDYVPPEGEKEDSRLKVQRALGSEQIYNRIVRLHRPFFIRGYTDPKFEPSTTACLCAARMVLAMQRRLRGESSMLASWEFFTIHLLASSLVIIIDLFHAVEENHSIPFTPLRASEMEQRRKEVYTCVEDFKASVKECNMFTRGLAVSSLSIIQELLAAEEGYRVQARTSKTLPPFEEALNGVLKKLSQKVQPKVEEDDDFNSEPHSGKATDDVEDHGMKLLRDLGLLGPNWLSQPEPVAMGLDAFLPSYAEAGGNEQTGDAEGQSSFLWEGTDWLLKYFREDVNSALPQVF